MNTGQKLSFHYGTFLDSVPEILLGGFYDVSKVDIWALEMVPYFVIAGRVPFDAVKVQQLQRLVLSGKYPVPTGISI